MHRGFAGVRRIILFSIRPEYARAILAGIKKFELRRGSALNIQPGSIAVLYASGKVKRIVGHFTVGKVFRGSPAYVWRIVTSKKEYGIGVDAKKYIEGSTSAAAIEVLNPHAYTSRISLNEIRMILPGWNPPLSYTILNEGDPFVEIILKPLWRKEGILEKLLGHENQASKNMD